MATIRHWTVNSANDEHNTLVGAEEQHVLIGRRVAAMEGNIKRAMDDAETRQLAASNANAVRVSDEFSAIRSQAVLDWSSFGAQHRDSVDQLVERISRQTEGFAVGLSSLSKSVNEQLEATAKRVSGEVEFLSRTSRAALRVVQDDYASAVIRLGAERDRTMGALKATHATELAGLRAAQAAVMVEKDKALAQSAVRLKRWAIVTVVGLVLNASAVVAAILR